MTQQLNMSDCVEIDGQIYELSAYPEAYLKHLVAQHGKQFAVELLEQWEQTPANAPSDVWDVCPGSICFKNRNGNFVHSGMIFIGEAFSELEIGQDDKFGFGYIGDQSDHVAEVLNWCDQNLSSHWWFNCWPTSENNADLVNYYVQLTGKDDPILFDLTWKGILDKQPK